MCRLFGFRSNVPSRAHRSLLEAENAMAAQARQNADGWGIGWFQGTEPYVLKAEGGAASDERFHRISRRLTSHTFLVHVRRATVGQLDQLNSHPFRHARWMFAHNGTIFDFDRIGDRIQAEIDPDLQDMIFGDTDSEYLFFYLLSAMRRVGVCQLGRSPVDVPVAARALRDALDQLYGWCDDAGLQPPLCNYILTNGDAFFAQRAGLGLHLATQKARCRDFESCTAEKLCMRPAPGLPTLTVAQDASVRRCNHVLVASERIGSEDLWEELPQGHLVAVDGNLDLHIWGPGPSFKENPDWPRVCTPPDGSETPEGT